VTFCNRWAGKNRGRSRPNNPGNIPDIHILYKPGI
jgi:hypothetical protein